MTTFSLLGFSMGLETEEVNPNFLRIAPVPTIARRSPFDGIRFNPSLTISRRRHSPG
jgi:hypothetical protein